MLVDRDGYEIYDLKGKKTERVQGRQRRRSRPILRARLHDRSHFANFIAGIRKGEKLNAPIAVGNVSVTMLQLSNIAWEVNRELHARHRGRQDPERCRSHEVLGPRIREGLGAASLERRSDNCNNINNSRSPFEDDNKQCNVNLKGNRPIPPSWR